LPAIASGLTGFLVLILIFKKQLSTPVVRQTLEQKQYRPTVIKIPMIVTVIHLIVCIIALAFCDALKIEMWLICLALFFSLTIFNIVYDLIIVLSIRPVLHSIKKAPFELIPFVLSMFIIVLALKNNGVTDILCQTLVGGQKTDGVSFGFLSAISANLLNNIPMSVLFEKIISGTSISAVYGAIIGSNVGAFITPVGALAGIMWSKILAKYDIKMPFVKFLLYGGAVAIPTLLAGSLCLLLVL
jgi:arsenical pump membrane protein